MKEKEFKDLIQDYVLNKLTAKKREAFELYLEDHSTFKSDVNEWQRFVNSINLVNKEPSPSMDKAFYGFLQAEMQKDEINKENKVRHLDFGKSNQGYRFLMPFIAASILFVFGLFLGAQWNSTNSISTNQTVADTTIESYKKETDAIRTDLVITLASQPSASERLQALSEASKLDQATEQVIMALFKMLNSDTNVNVRLAAVTSLSKYVDNPSVREGLVLSITNQDSPLVQIALADLMVTLKEEKSIKSFESLLNKGDMDTTVKKKLEESIKQII